MSAEIIDGKAIAAKVREEVARDVAAFTARTGRQPGLATILVGEDPASAIYVANKRKSAGEVGIASFHHELAADATTEQVEALIEQLNDDDNVSGILCQLPVPDHLDGVHLTGLIDARKDVDGLTPLSAGYLALGREGLRPCTPAGCMRLLAEADVELSGKHAVVIGRSNLFGKPMAQLLLAANATVTIAHSRTADLPAVARTPTCWSPPSGVTGWSRPTGSSRAPRSSTWGSTDQTTAFMAMSTSPRPSRSPVRSRRSPAASGR